jgi:hypothetical protein
LEALAVMALPPVRQAANSTLTIARTEYEPVREQESYFTSLPKRFTDLLLAVTKQSNLRPNDLLLLLADVGSPEKYVSIRIHKRFKLRFI